MKYRKRPVEIDAFCWTGGPDQTEDPEWIVEAIKTGFAGIIDPGKPDMHMAIRTLEGVMIAQPGDWIIRGIKGELYPCKPDIFEATYEKAGTDFDPANTQTDEQATDTDTRLRKGFAELINSVSRENASDTPDFLIADFLFDCLTAFEDTVRRRTHWYRPADDPDAPLPGDSLATPLSD